MAHSTENTNLKQQLQQLDPYDFEKLVAKLWANQGWKTEVTQGSNDRGIDVIATREGITNEKHLIQAKRYSKGNKVGSQEVRNYATLYQQDSEADCVTIVTTSTFTTEARQLATDLDVKAIDGDDLCRISSNSTSNNSAINLGKSVNDSNFKGISTNTVSVHQLKSLKEDIQQLLDVVQQNATEVTKAVKRYSLCVAIHKGDQSVLAEDDLHQSSVPVSLIEESSTNLENSKKTLREIRVRYQKISLHEAPSEELSNEYQGLDEDIKAHIDLSESILDYLQNNSIGQISVMVAEIESISSQLKTNTKQIQRRTPRLIQQIEQDILHMYPLDKSGFDSRNRESSNQDLSDKDNSITGDPSIITDSTKPQGEIWSKESLKSLTVIFSIFVIGYFIPGEIGGVIALSAILVGVFHLHMIYKY